MVPPLPKFSSSGLLLAAAQHVPLLRTFLSLAPADSVPHALARRDINSPDERVQFVVFACLIPVLVLLSGLFAGLTLGYMSLDETQLNVLSVSGTP